MLEMVYTYAPHLVRFGIFCRPENRKPPILPFFELCHSVVVAPPSVLETKLNAGTYLQMLYAGTFTV